MGFQRPLRRVLAQLLRWALLLVSAAAVAGTALAAPAVADGELLFLSNRRDSVFEYYRMQPDGSRLLRLLAEEGGVNDLSVSPDGRSVLYTRAPRGGLHNVFVTTLADGSTRQLTADKLPVAQPVWSSDGRRIAFVAMREGVRKIEVMDADGANRRRASDTPAEVDEIAPAFSPDGSQLAFLASNRDAATRVSVAGLGDGGKTRQLNPDQQRRFETPPQWSPDGRRVLFTAIVGNGAHLMAAAADGSGVVALTRGADRHTEPQWSPDGSRVLFFALAPTEARARLGVAQADGSQPRLLYGGENDLLGARWSCDGRRILFIEQQAEGGRIQAIGAEGGAVTPLSRGEGFDARLQVHCGPGAERLAALR